MCLYCSTWHKIIKKEEGGHLVQSKYVTELAHPHKQSSWRSKGKRVRTAELVACCNYFSKKKKKCVDPEGYNFYSIDWYNSTLAYIIFNFIVNILLIINNWMTT